MLSGAIAHQILQREHSSTIKSVITILKQHPWYAERWQRQVATLSAAGAIGTALDAGRRMGRWIRMNRGSEHRRQWHYIDRPFKPAGEPSIVEA